ncbi:MAG: CRISPR-associated endonuclease Cas2 [Clostridia bacterium]|nr:CRISPR-associated endonuclease Cas2 [Clostridia bacterium]
MIIISYDISNDKKRAKFNKYIRRFGYMLQYSVYEIENSERILSNVITDLNNRWLKQFDQTDSVYIFHMSNSCEIMKYGYAKNEDADLLIVN